MANAVHAVALGALLAAAATGPAFADAYTINSYSVPNGMNVTITDTTLSVSEGGDSGAISISVTDTTTSSTSQMTVFCSDISALLTTPASYTLGTLTNNIGQPNYAYLDATRVNQVNALLNAAALGLVNINNATASAALQAAIWTVIYQSDAGDTGYNVTAGNFYISSYGGDNVSTVETDANQYLTYITNGTWTANSADTVEQFTSSSDQTLIYLGVTATGRQAGVPEPGSLALLATGLAGFGVLRRRRARG